MPQSLLWVFIALELVAIVLLVWKLRHSQNEWGTKQKETKLEIQTRMGQDLVRVVRNQRHGFMNHLQVISGWLQLNKADRALEYISSVRRKREQEVQIFRVANWELITQLITRSSAAEASEIEVVWKIDSHLRWASKEMIDWVNQSFDKAFDRLVQIEGPRQIEASLSDEGSIYLVTLKCSDGKIHQATFPVVPDDQY